MLDPIGYRFAILQEKCYLTEKSLSGLGMRDFPVKMKLNLFLVCFSGYNSGFGLMNDLLDHFM